MRTLLVLILFFTYFYNISCQHRPADVTDYRGLKFGATVDQAKKVFLNKEFRIPDYSESGLKALEFQDMIFNKKATVTLLFANGKFAKSTVEFKDENEVSYVATEAQLSLESKYGYPDKKEKDYLWIDYKFPSTSIRLFSDRHKRTINLSYESVIFKKWRDTKEDKEKI